LYAAFVSKSITQNLKLILLGIVQSHKTAKT